MAKKTIKYLENGEYHDATVKDVGVIEELKTESKDNLVEAINEIFLGGGKGFSDLQQKVDESTQAAQNAQQATDNLQQRLEEVANAGLSDEEAQKIINQAVEDAKRAQAEALQAYKDAQKELDDSMAQFMEEQKAINKELEQAKTDIQGDIDQKNTEIEQINAVIESTKSDLTATSAQLASVRNDLTNAQMDWGKVRTEITNINGKLDSKMSNTDFDEYKERIEHNETEITQTKNELQSKATKQDLDVLTGTVTTQGSNIIQLAGKIEQKVSKDTLANDIDDFQVKKANIFTGTREFMGWEFSDKALGRVNNDSYNHTKVAELHNGSNLSITVDGLEVGKTYSVSIFAKVSTNSNTSGVRVTVDNGKSYSGLMKTVYTPHDTKVTTDWQRYYATIVASATTMKFVFDRSGMTSDITLYLNRPKLEVGETVYAWEDNAQDIYKRVEHTEAQFDVYDDQISGIVQRQTETDKKIEKVSTTLTQRADGIEANSKKYTDDKTTGLAEEFSGKLKATSQELSTEYEEQTNAKIGALSDGGSNLILNSSFLITDDNGNATLENWRDTSSKVSLTKPNGLDGTWIKVNRATTGTALGARSNYFPVKQGKLVVGVDVALDGTGNISPYVLRIEYYDVSNNRVNYEDITLQKLGLSVNQITKSGSSFRYARGVYKTSNDRSDVAKACIVVPETITGYDMYLTNFFAKFSDVNDGTYEVNPLDQQASLIKQRTKIEQDSEKINLLNTQTEKLGNDIKATNTSVNVLKGEVDLKASQSTVNDLTNRVAKNVADIKVFPDRIKSEVSEVNKKIDGVNSKVDNIKVGGTNLLKDSLVPLTTSNIWINNNVYSQIVNDYVRIRGIDDNDNNRIYQSFSNNGLNADDYYSISFWASNDGNDEEFDVQVGTWGSLQTVHITGSTLKLYKLENVWLGGNPIFSVVVPFDKVVRLKKIKLEKGTIATDWSPAPEDLQEEINTATTKATQTDTKFERMISQIQYNDSTGEIGKYEHKITELANGTQEKISALTKRGNNMVIKSNFDDGTDLGGWYVASEYGSDLYRTTTTPKPDEMSSNYCLASGARDALEGNNIFPVVSGTKYYISAWVYTSQMYSGKVGLRVKNSNNNNMTYLGVTVPKDNQNRWIKIKGTITIPNGYNIAQPWLEVEKTVSDNEKIYFADISITRADDNAIELSETMTTRIGDLERTVRTNTTDIGQYRQEMTNSAKEWSTKFTSITNGIGGTNLLRNTRFSDGSNWGYTGTAHMGTQNTNKPSGVPNDNQTMDIMSTTANSRNALTQTPKVKAGETYIVSFWAKADEKTYMQVESNQNTRFNQKIGTSWQKYSGQVMFQSDNRTLYIYPTTANVWVHINSLKLEKGTIATDWSPSPEDFDNKIEILQGQITANANKFNTVYTKTDVDNKINPLNSRTEFLQDNSKFLLRVQQAGGATQADVNSANSKIGDLSTRVKNTEVAITSGGVTINGNTKINGELQAQNMVLKGKSSTMALNGDGGVGIFSNDKLFATRLVGHTLEFDLNFNNTLERLGGISAAMNQKENNVNGISLNVTPQQTLGKPYGGDEISIGKVTSINGDKMSIESGMVYNATGVNKGAGFHWYDEEYKHGKGTLTHIENARDPLFWTGGKWNTSTQPTYIQPTVQLGYNTNTYGNSGVSFYWNSIKPFGTLDMTDVNIWMADAEARLRFGWINWSDWTGKIPSLYRTPHDSAKAIGGIGVGGDGNVILFGGNRRWDMNHH